MPLLSWKDVLHTVPTYLPKETSLLQALQSFAEKDCRLLFIQEHANKIVGYIDHDTLLKQIYAVQDLHKPIVWKEDFCEVSALAPIMYPQPYPVFLVLEDDGTIAGYATSQDIRIHLEQHQRRLHQSINEDLQNMHAQAGEQIIVVNQAGRIVHAAGSFLRDVWLLDQPQQLIGKDMARLEKEGVLRPNLAALCLFQKKRLSMIQEAKNGRKIWSIATPVLREQTVEKVMIVSRELPSEQETLPTACHSKCGAKEQPHQLVYRSTVMQRLVDELEHIAKVGSTVLFMGESGVGKEVFAKALHHFSDRREEPFIRVNCGAIPANLLESELFGYEKGAFTGADQRGKPGLFELAHRGTIFLDEIADLPYSMQVKLLRVLQEREIMRIGGVRTIPVDIRVVAATNQDIRALVKAQKFREDLYYRLYVIPIEIPPLRKRKADIVPLALHFLHEYNQVYQLDKKLSPEAFDLLQQYDWPGNVRELQNVMERSIVTARGELITAEQLWANLYSPITLESEKKPIVQEIIPLKEAVEEVESQLISLAMKKYGTAAKVAKILGVSPATVSRRMQKHLQ